MVEHVLVPYDGSPLADRALERAVTAPDTRVTLLHVITQFGVVDGAEPDDTESASWSDRAHDAAERLLTGAVERAADLAPACSVETVVDIGPPAPEILLYVAENEVDHVVVGGHGKAGGAGPGLGSVAERVVREAPVPVTVVR